jgi:hypothetical protein
MEPKRWLMIEYQRTKYRIVYNKNQTTQELFKLLEEKMSLKQNSFYIAYTPRNSVNYSFITYNTIGTIESLIIVPGTVLTVKLYKDYRKIAIQITCLIIAMCALYYYYKKK